ncbi:MULTISPECIES: aldehyde dehydrogenase family protein [Streptomyces]|uniref:aldehyde dehydrogenase family protein n=1 Tax=Streptomyces TaxID=1883 RepID=UPI000D1BCAEE|nr:MULTISPECIES: aldehyde dehydrogenase family protein [Streptomyces]MYU12100.1 aldehyde dehydrogenase family protein [Streptomyces sp. SID8361]MCC4320499.1 aldehyde dehydrogenase family protein [Streptomyces malaysiensis]MCD9593867.1 aldehyde dehydrogenase family protein [Streptomyces sp. 8ZJF_21]MCQ6251240.1 aldehyde dehydrogenase family protein [Streptomyces malaysiensis]WHX24467.1 aldehyde dehydrogenase family protein [Streptomyces sp. NA07423]
MSTAAAGHARRCCRQRSARRIRTSRVSVNGGNSVLIAPFGGFMQSGVGREGEPEGLRALTELMAIGLPKAVSE